jgi:hypothetical protein
MRRAPRINDVTICFVVVIFKNLIMEQPPKLKIKVLYIYIDKSKKSVKTAKMP